MADNWYIVLELEFDPPVEDEKTIADRIEEKSKFWSTHFNDFKMGAQYRSWHQNIPKIKKDMIGPDNIRKQLAADACTKVYGPVDKLLKTIGRKGNITSDEGDKLAKKLKISIDIVKKRAKSLGITWTSAKSADYQTTYDKYYKTKPQNSASFDGMKQMLSSFGVDNLYDFLYQNTSIKNANRLPCETLRQRATEKKKTEFYKNDSVSGTGSKLCGQCDIVFKDEKSKDIYDKYLEYIKRKSILDDAKSIADISGELTTEQGEDIIGQLTQLFRDRNLAEEVLIAFCKVEKIAYNTGSTPDNRKNIKICRCGCMNDVSDGRKICSNCGLELVIKCPKCGTENDANIRVCKCGFKFENLDKAVALCEQAEIAIETLDFDVAQAHLNDAERYWSGSSKVASLKQKLKEFKDRVGAEVARMREAIKLKKYHEAKKQYQTIKKLFTSYSDVEIENEIEQAISNAKKLFEQAKSTKDEKKILELCALAYDACSDYPGIKELMPAPANVTGFKVTCNNRSNIISWTATSDRSVRYVVVRSESGWIDNISSGEVIFRGSASSYADKKIEAGVPYYYNVFVERAGVYSKGAIGEFKETINLFEVENVTISSADSSLNITWDNIPRNATVEIYELQSNGSSRHITSTTSNSYLVTGLANDTVYKFQVSLSYVILGKRRETTGVVVSGTPVTPPIPIDTLHIKLVQEGRFDAVWVKPKVGEVALYSSTVKPKYRIGDTISVSELNRTMTQLQQKPLSVQTNGTLKNDETGAGFDYSGSDVLFVSAVVIKSGSAVFGNLSRASIGETVAIKSIRAVNGKINIYLDVPHNATGFVVLYRHDQFPTDISDIKTVRKHVPIKQYQLNSAIVLDSLEEKKYYFSVFAEFKNDGENDYSAGADYLFDNTSKVNISYSIAISKRLFGESYIILEFEADSKEFFLPDIDVMSAIGNTPMFKNSAKLMHSISAQSVSGSVQIKIPMPKNLPRDTYIKAFFKDEASQKGSQLRLKLKSNYKIS